MVRRRWCEKVAADPVWIRWPRARRRRMVPAMGRLAKSSACMALVLLVGCAGTLRVSSEPSGAKILVNGQDSGRTTPAAMRLRDLPLGKPAISVETQAGVRSTEQQVKVSPSAGIIVWSLLIPIPLGLINLFRGFSKVQPKTIHFNVAQVAAATGPAVPQPEPRQTPASGLQTYTGERHKIRALGTRCAALPIQPIDVPEEVVFLSDELLLTELQHSGFEAIGPDDVSAMLGFEKLKETVDCNDATCIAEIGGSLGVTYLVAGKVAMLEGGLVLTLKLVDVQHAVVLARTSRMSDGGTGALPRLLAESVQEIVARSGL